MAQIVTITNPLTGQPAQVDQLEHTAQQIDDAIARALPGGAIDITLQNKAPAGYGLGTNAVPIDDYNNAVNNGWYRGGTNYPSKINYASYGMIRVDSVGQNKFQTFYAGDDGSNMVAPFMAMRKSTNYGKTWSEWEYVNPSMLLGVEYRTTERYLGKPVYAKVVSLGTGPDSGTAKSVEHGIVNMMHIVDYCAELMKNSGSALSLPYYISDENQARMYVNTSVFCITAGSTSLSAYNTCFGWVKYTKTTD